MTEPIRENERRTELGCEAEMVFRPESDFFDGHFEGAPVLPGVVQTGVAVRELERLLGRAVRVTEIKKLKFARVVHPGERVKFSLEGKGEDEWAFRYESGGALCSSGTIVMSKHIKNPLYPASAGKTDF